MLKRAIRGMLFQERGVTVVLVALMLLVLLGFAAMAVDVGELLWNRHALQNAVDAAALAGVRELPEDPAAADTVARRYLADNLAELSDVDIQVDVPPAGRFNPYDSIIVTATRKVAPGLRSAVGGGDTDVPATAEAVVVPVEPTCNIWPWAIDEMVTPFTDTTQLLPYSSTYGLKVALKVVPRAQLSPGNFGAICLDGDKCGSDEYRDYIKEQGCVASRTLYTKPGDVVGPTKQGIYEDQEKHGLGAVLQCVHNYDPDTGQPDEDCVHWWNDGTNDGKPYGLGCPGTPDCGHCSGPPSTGEPYPPVVVGDYSCGRVGIIPIVRHGDFDAGRDQVYVVDFAAFYLIGLEERVEEVEKDNGKGGKTKEKVTQPYVIGSFLDPVEVQVGNPKYGDPIEDLRGYFLWR